MNGTYIKKKSKILIIKNSSSKDYLLKLEKIAVDCAPANATLMISLDDRPEFRGKLIYHPKDVSFEQ